MGIRMRKKTGATFLWRGMLGGLLGCFLGIAILYLSYFQHAGRAAYWGFFGILGTLPVTVVCGTIVGALIWGGTRLLRTGRLAGAAIGAVGAAAIGLLIGAILDSQIANQDPNDRQWFFTLYGLIAGAVTGVVSGSQDHRGPD
jgi:hypothetical protein